MLWTSSYPSFQANSDQSKYALLCWDNSEELGMATHLTPEPGGFLISQEQQVLSALQWVWCWCCCVYWVLFLFVRFIFTILQEEHFSKTHFSFAIKLNYLFWAINTKSLLQEDIVIYKCSKRKRMMQRLWSAREGLLGNGKQKDSEKTLNNQFNLAGKFSWAILHGSYH